MMNQLEPVYDRQPPFSEEAEVSVLGGMIGFPDSIAEVAGTLKGEMFYFERNRRLFRCAVDLYRKGDAVDVVTIFDELRRRDEVEAAGGPEYISALLDAVPTAANISHHANIVASKYKLRLLIDGMQSTIREIYEGVALPKIFDAAEERLIEARSDKGVGGYQPMSSGITDAMVSIEQEAGADGGVTGVPTGIPTLDLLTAGLQPGRLYIIAGRPSHGKSAFAQGIAETGAVHGYSIAFSSLEMGKEELVRRSLSRRSRVDLMSIREHGITPEQSEALGHAAQWVSTLPIHIDDQPGATVIDIRARLRRLMMRQQVDMLVVDYLQLMEGEGETRNHQVASLSRGLKRLAREFRIPVVALSQLSRAVENRHPPRPKLSDLRDSGEIEQDADVVMGLWRPEMYFTDDTPAEDYAEWQGVGQLLVLKQRNGPTGTVTLHFDKATTRFSELQRTIAPGV